MNLRRVVVLLLLPALLIGCRSARSLVSTDSPARRDSINADVTPETTIASKSRKKKSVAARDETNHEPSGIVTVSLSEAAASNDKPNQSDEDRAGVESPVTVDRSNNGAGLAEGQNVQPLQLNTVVQSIYASYPLLQIAIYGRNIAAGEQLSAEGAWDLKLKADANNAPVGFYKTYRNGVGFEQPTMWGGEIFGGYKLGDGNFEPWYGNRETNEGGEFRGGITVPLWQNRKIDERRATLWKSMYGVSAVEPIIQSQIIEFTRAGTHAYWDWVAEGSKLRFARELLELAQQRDDQIEGQVKAGARPEADLADNRRLIVSREIKLIEAERKLQTMAVKLSLFLRTFDGQPLVPTEQQLPLAFPTATPIEANKIPMDVAEAIARRPELTELDFQYRFAQIDLQQAQNLTQPELDATMWSAQDVGAAASKKGDKTPFQAEAGLAFSVPLQRRKALGKIAAVEGKLVQIATKRQFAENKISTEVQNAVITIDAAFRSLDKARESVTLNEQMERFEATKLEKGDSDLLRLNLRESATFDARITEIEAQLHYFESQADYRAALALDVAEFGLLQSPADQPIPPAP